MGIGTEGAQAVTLRDYLNVARRRKWIIVQAVVLVPLAAIAFSLQQQTLYRASAQVLLSSQNLAAELTGTQTSTSAPDRVAQTQADLAGTPAVAALTLRRVPGTGLTPAGFLGAASVSTATNADLLTFGVTNRDPALAQKLVDAYASAYTLYRRELDTSAIKRALTGVDKRIAQLARAHDTKSALYASLVERQQTLETMQALQTSNASVVKRADGAAQTQPKTKRNAILGLMLGLVLGLGLAFLRESLDTRVRSAEEIAERLGGLPLLARLPEPDRKLRAERRLVMLRNSSGPQAETFRMLRTNLEFATLGRDVRTIMITSAVEQEGKSTTIANLAIALARAGKRVVLVDLDLRRPFLDKFFDLGGPGVTQVALGHATLERALVPLAVGGSAVLAARPNGNGNGHGAVAGVLEVLPSGPIPPDPGEFVGSEALSAILATLRERADVVLIDAPPLLHVGDASTLSTKVDGIVLATRLNVVRRHMLHELHRQLATLPTPVLGFVLTGASEEAGYGYGYQYHPQAYEPRESQERARAES
ncbi:MAG TPA: GNVR domain-containing protein [Gaiellaceae bacterium]|nr:GNVR domain-containing protein [Gaiellaceae bacterium]